MKSLLAAFVILALNSTLVHALSNDAKVPILVYHTTNVQNPCGYSWDTSVALASDLEAMHLRDITVVPVYWLVEWAVGDRDGSTLPDRVVGITLDDGLDLDWRDLDIAGHDCGSHMKSARTVMLEFKNAHPELPWYSPHASSFVISSPVARQYLGAGYYSDDWWYAAQNSGMFEIYNHSADHDIQNFPGYMIYDPSLEVVLAVGGQYDGNWNGNGNFQRAGLSETVAQGEIVNAANYISGKIGVYPDLFALPFGVTNPGVVNWLATNQSLHRNYAAFGGTGTYLMRGQNRWDLPRLTHNGHWHSVEEFSALLTNAGY